MLHGDTSGGEISSTVLRTRRHDATAGQRDGSEEAGQRFITCAAEFERQALADTPLEIGLADIADAEPAWRRSFRLPTLDCALGVLDIDGQVRMRVSPVDLRQR